MNEEKHIITLLGSNGGVGKAVLSILNKAAEDSLDPIHHVVKGSEIHLIDKVKMDKTYFEKFVPSLSLQYYTFDLDDTNAFKQHLTESKTSIVVDVSWADTIEMIQCCDELGVKYVNTALENREVDEREEEFYGFPLMERLRIFEEYRNQVTRTTAIIGSGMNPGVVQWMALELMGREKEEQLLGWYVIEEDTSFFKDPKKAKRDVLYTTWAPECFLDEAISSYPMFMKGKTPLFLHEHVYDLEFKVSLGKKEFYGCLMPHEEVYTFCKLFNIEGGFIYQINNHTSTVIRKNLGDSDKLWDFDMVVLNPEKHELIGEDTVGVLLVYKNKECYMYNVGSNKEIYEKFGTNATYFQVACGVYAGLSTLILDSLPVGAYYVDELILKTETKYGQYVKKYIGELIIGENNDSDGLLLDRMREYKEE